MEQEDKIINKDITTSSPAGEKQETASPYATLFKTFFKIGAFTLGGGYAMIPIIEGEVVDKNHWIEKEDFLDLIAIAQSCPGVFAINISTFIGYKLKGNKGALCTTLGTALPSFLIILLIAMFFHQFMNVGWIAAMFRGIRPAVVALIAAPTFSLAKSAHITLSNCWIPLASALLIWQLGVSPVFIIIAAGLGGYLYGLLIKPTES
jgi:chromate transporter